MISSIYFESWRILWLMKTHFMDKNMEHFWYSFSYYEFCLEWCIDLGANWICNGIPLSYPLINISSCCYAQLRSHLKYNMKVVLIDSLIMYILDQQLHSIGLSKQQHFQPLLCPIELSSKIQFQINDQKDFNLIIILESRFIVISSVPVCTCWFDQH